MITENLTRFDIESYLKVKEAKRITPKDGDILPSVEDHTAFKKVRKMMGLDGGYRGEVLVELIGIQAKDVPNTILFNLEHYHGPDGECLRRRQGPRCGALTEPVKGLKEVRETLELTNKKRGYQEMKDGRS